MARISDDDSSWKASGLKKKNADWEHEHASKTKPKKNTKKWCKGKVGKEHDFKTQAPKRYSGSPWTINGKPSYVVDCCKVCGKEINFRRNPELPKSKWWLGK